MLLRLMCLACLTWPNSIWAATYYVDNGLPGSDSNNGTSEATPFLTVQKCLDVMTTGPNTCLVKNGTYTQALRFLYGGSAGNPIELKNYPGHAPILRSADSSISTNMILMQGPSYPAAIGYITIEGFEITNFYFGIKPVNVDHLTISKVNLHGNLHSGIQGQGYLVTIRQSKIYHNGDFAGCGAPCNQDHGIYVSGHNWTIVDNAIYDNLAYGIQLAAYAYSAGSCATINYCEGSDWVIANNTLSQNYNRAGITLWQTGGALANCLIANNIFYDNAWHAAPGNSGIDILSEGTLSATINNNLWYVLTSNTWISTAGCSGCYTESNTLNTDPLMVSPATPNYNFHLQSSSPAIGNGADMSAYAPTDLDGYSRPQGGSWDRGAYEYIAAGSVSGGRGVKGLALF